MSDKHSLTELLKYPKLIKSNILEVFEQHTLQDYTEAKEWYPAAKRLGISFSEKYNIPVMNAIGIIAATSVQKSWTENQKVADLYFRGIYKHTTRQIEKCKKIEKAKSYAEISGILGGMKTKDFFGSIYFEGNSKHFCIDRHVISLAAGIPIYSCNKLQYVKLKKIYQEVAKEAAVAPTLFQSIIWVTYRRIKNVKF